MENKSESNKGITLILISAILVCVGQLFWKLSAEYGFVMLISGFAMYGVGAILMVLSYRYGELSVLQPLLSINYVLSAVLGVIVLQEVLSIQKILAIVLISIGVVLIGRSAND